MRFARPLLVGALAAGSFLVSAPAQAACAGTQEIFFVCVTTPTVTQSSITQCVYLGGDECEDVTVPIARVSGGGDVSCGGSIKLATCTVVGDLFRPCGPLVACP